MKADYQSEFQSFPQRVLNYGETQPDATACIFQTQGPETAQKLSWGELRRKVLERASLLLAHNLAAKPVALIFPTGIEFVIDFLACLYTGTIAVPLKLSRNLQQFSRALNIMEDAGVAAVLTTAKARAFLQDALQTVPREIQPLLWLDEHAVAESVMAPEPVKASQLAFIQYTSGSTSRPKGVMVTHANLLNNQRAIQQACQHQQGLIGGGWLPQFHDMGLIGQMMQPLYLGGTYVFMPPMSFIQRPRRWLELISHYRLQSSASPNFGYDHCVRCIIDGEDLSGLDLSCWKVAGNGAEPVNRASMEAFQQKFAAYGFKPSAFFPCYGMAETTLFVAGGAANTGVKTATFDTEAFEAGMLKPANTGTEIVSCGVISPVFDLRIVNPDTLEECADSVIGEIWIHGNSVADGYWKNGAQTQKSFRATIQGGNGRHYLRTGDLGFICDNELYVTGRIKELIIIRGRNLYPYDIERTCNSYRHASGHGAAVFAVEQEGRSQLAAIVELNKPAFIDGDLAEMEFDIKGMVMDTCDVALDILHLVEPGTIPRTTSGKIRRVKCQSILPQLKIVNG